MDGSSSGRTAPRSITRLVATILLVCVLLLGAGGIAFVWLTIPPKHLVSGAVRIAPTVSGLLDSEPKPFNREVYTTYVHTQAALLSTSHILQTVVDDLASRQLTFFSSPEKAVSTEPGFPSPEHILRQAIADRTIRIAPVPDTELLRITMVSEQEEEAKTIVDSFLRNYVARWAVDEARAASENLTTMERQSHELAKRIMDARAQLRAISGDSGTAYVDPRADMELQRRNSLLRELVQAQTRRMSLEVAMESSAEEGTVAADPEDWLSRRQDYVASDPLVQALAHRIAGMQVDLATAREKEPDDTATIERQQKVLDTLDQQLGKLRQTRQQQFEEELSEALKRQSRQRLAKTRMELQQVKAYEERLQQVLREQEKGRSRVRSASPDVQDRQSQLRLDEELYEKICRRIRDMEVGRNHPPRVELAYMADVEGLVDDRRQWTLIMLGATVLLTVILLIVRRACRP